MVVVLGHVDHGKTKILDYIRKTKVAEGEAGGITQHIGAYQVEVKSQGSTFVKKITFLDTPGHEAFSAIRSRGVKVADIAVLVVAADEGVKPQTKEAIKIIEEAKMPFVVALNKIDKENANLQKVKQDLAENNVLIEEWGGKVPAVEVSAKTGQGIDVLLDMILLVAEMEELKAGDKAEGVVIESHLDSRRGAVATILVRGGVFKVNDWIVAGTEAVRIKDIQNFLGKTVDSVGPSQPAVVLGWSYPPVLGETVKLAASREEADGLAKTNARLGKPAIFVKESGPEKNKAKILNLILKADVSSSLEAIDMVLKTIKSEEVGYSVVDFGLGEISEGDIKKAVATKALVIGFHVSTTDSIRQMAERSGVFTETFEIIYELVESVKKKMSELLDPQINRIPLGRLKVLAVFKKDTKMQVVGGKVVSGKIKRGALIDVLRNNAVVAKCKLSQLQQKKVDVEEVAEGMEAGIKADFLGKSIMPNMFIREGDLLEVYEEERIKRSI